jgi:probable DNA metabolism protein
MYSVALPAGAGENEFRAAARRCLAAGLKPEQVVFTDAHEASLLPPAPEADAAPPVSVPRAYTELLADAICHRARDRFALLYEVLWRIVQGEPNLLSRAADPAVARLEEYARNVRRDIHKMHAFLRFRPQETEGRTLYAAWFEPQHFVLRRAVPFFVDRFASMDWLILTPMGTALWQDGNLAFGPPAEKPETSADDVLDELWLTYYRTTFNPARVRLDAMQREMPKLYWRNMPETTAIPAMIASSESRVGAMRARTADEPPHFAERIAARAKDDSPAAPSAGLAALRAQAAACTRCPLHGPATQTVFGEGPNDAALVFVGEQPGDQEDLAGRPFVGPAGELFDRALAAASIPRGEIYVTNAVKHFKYAPRGKRRIHQKPNAGEVHACKWWLEKELTLIRPRLVVALGATAARAMAGRTVSVLKERGPARFETGAGFITVHPSFLLRLPDRTRQEDEYARFVEDLRRVRELLGFMEKAA